jgi:dTDP-4-amino-4,6-dideoxygalactose transaminase
MNLARRLPVRLVCLDEENSCRRRFDARYRDLLAELDGIDPTLPPSSRLKASHHLFAIVLGEQLNRDVFRATVPERGVQTSVHYPPVHRFSIYCDRAPDLPVTDAYAARAVTLPMFAHMTETQQDLVVEAVTHAVRCAAAT